MANDGAEPLRQSYEFRGPASEPAPSRLADESVQALSARAPTVLQQPARIDQADAAACASAFRISGGADEAYAGALRLLSAIVYWRPELVDKSIVAELERLLADRERSEATYEYAAEVLASLIATPACNAAVGAMQGLLARDNLSTLAYGPILQALGVVSAWTTQLLDMKTLVDLAERAHLERYRVRLLRTVMEPVIFADLTAVSAPLLERVLQIFRDEPDLKYLLQYISGRPDVPRLTRERAASAATGLFPLHRPVAAMLGSETATVLVVQNIADQQGDEIIRVVTLLESLLSFNPQLEVVLITNREYLYGHSRLTLVPIKDEAGIEAVLRDRFDLVIDFYEPVVPQVNYSNGLERQVQKHVRTHPPALHITARKGWNSFVYQRVDVQGRGYAEELGLTHQRVSSIYETTLRLIAELGLPLRLGEEPPQADSIIASLPFPPAEDAWSTLLERNVGGRPVALVCPFGGTERLKGYVERQAPGLAARLRELIDEGYYVVLLPNGMPWGSARHARDVASRLPPTHQAHIVVAPDPADGTGSVTYRHAGTHTVPHASYEMRLITYFVRFADLIVAVEGWMVHAAYCLGKRFRILMLPYSHPSDWHPYGRTRHQAPVLSTTPPSPEDASLPPLPDKPRKFVLTSLLRRLGAAGDKRALPVVHLALESEDRDVRLAATVALRYFRGPDIDAALCDLLGDSFYRVRATAAAALLDRSASQSAPESRVPRELLEAYRRIGEDARSWPDILSLGEGARPALLAGLDDDDLVIQREAAIALRALDHRSATRSSEESPMAIGEARAMLTRVFHAGEEASRRGIRMLRDLRRGPFRARPASGARPTVLILTPVKDAADCLDGYFRRLRQLTYPHDLISLGFLESDSSDTTFGDLQRHVRAIRRRFRRVGVWKKDFDYHIPPGMPRWAPEIQVERRRVMALSRNHLLFRALDDEAWVLWMDADVVEYPPDLIERLFDTEKDIVQPHCVLDYGGPTFDLNGWRDHGRLHLDDLRGEGELVELDAVGGTVLLVRADVHRDGLIYPPFLFGTANPRVRTGQREYIEGELTGEIETEGLGIMARDMGYQCWGMPHFEVIHRWV